MKAKELMIGDIISTNSALNPITKVAEIYANGIISEDGGTWLDDEIHPVELTPELLEKNGWAYDGIYSTLLQDGIEYLFYHDEGILRNYYEHKDCSAELIFLSRPGINYIHEFQHALRLCGIEKEIVL